MIRNATEHDLSRVAEGMVRLQQLHVNAYPKVYKPFSQSDAVSYLTGILSRPEFNIRVAINSDQIAGHSVLAVESTQKTMFKHAQKFGHVTQMEVDPEFQRRGIGKSLLDDACKLATQLGLNRIALDVWAFNDAARDLFIDCDFAPFGSKLVRVIDRVG